MWSSSGPAQHCSARHVHIHTHTQSQEYWLTSAKRTAATEEKLGVGQKLR